MLINKSELKRELKGTIAYSSAMAELDKILREEILPAAIAQMKKERCEKLLPRHVQKWKVNMSKPILQSVMEEIEEVQ